MNWAIYVPITAVIVFAIVAAWIHISNSFDMEIDMKRSVDREREEQEHNDNA